jgi:hypothetical protein
METMIWLANPIALNSLLFSKKQPQIGILLGVLSFGIAISFTKWSEILVSENGRNAKILSLDISYWIWISSIILLILLNIRNLYKKHMQTKK